MADCWARGCTELVNCLTGPSLPSPSAGHTQLALGHTHGFGETFGDIGGGFRTIFAVIRVFVCGGVVLECVAGVVCKVQSVECCDTSLSRVHSTSSCSNHGRVRRGDTLQM